MQRRSLRSFSRAWSMPGTSGTSAVEVVHLISTQVPTGPPSAVSLAAATEGITK